MYLLWFSACEVNRQKQTNFFPVNTQEATPTVRDDRETTAHPPLPSQGHGRSAWVRSLTEKAVTISRFLDYDAIPF